MVDRNGMRAGAGISAIVLLVGLVLDARVIVIIVLAALAIGALFGPQISPLGAIYRGLKTTLKLRIPKEPEEAAPPRFAQTVGTLFLGLSVFFFYATGSSVLGWTFAMIVAGLQGLLAVSGICVGCEIYLIGKRLAAKGA